MKKRIVSLMMAALMTASMMCSGVSAEEGTTITFWHAMGGTNGEALTYLVDKFNAENTEGIGGTVFSATFRSCISGQL